MLNLLSLASFINKFFLTIINNIASIFLILKLTAFRISYLITTLLTFYKISIILFILPSIINPNTSIKNK